MTHKRKRQTRRLVRAIGAMASAQAQLRRIQQCGSQGALGRCDLINGHPLDGVALHRYRIKGTSVVERW